MYIRLIKHISIFVLLMNGVRKWKEAQYLSCILDKYRRRCKCLLDRAVRLFESRWIYIQTKWVHYVYVHFVLCIQGQTTITDSAKCRLRWWTNIEYLKWVTKFFFLITNLNNWDRTNDGQAQNSHQGHWVTRDSWMLLSSLTNLF